MIDHRCVHAEIKILHMLVQENIGDNNRDKTCIIETSLKTCMHCSIIFNQIQKKLNFKIISRHNHSIFYDFEITKLFTEKYKEFKEDYNQLIQSNKKKRPQSHSPFDRSENKQVYDLLSPDRIDSFSLSKEMKKSIDKYIKLIIPQIKKSLFNEIIIDNIDRISQKSISIILLKNK